MGRLPSLILLMQKTKDPKNSPIKRRENIYMCLFLTSIKLLDAMEPSMSPKKLIDLMQRLKKPISLMQPLKKLLTL
jgi:hypothetical protein